MSEHRAPLRHNAVLMCGRFALITPPVRLAHYFQADLGDNLRARATPQLERRPH